MSALTFDSTGSVATSGERVFPIGARVVVTRGGTVQPWEDVVVHRHDRNRTYRLRFPNDTFVTAHEDELSLDLDACPLHGAECSAWPTNDGQPEISDWELALLAPREDELAPHRADIGRERILCATLRDAALEVEKAGYGAIAKRAGKVYRVISGRDQDAALAALQAERDEAELAPTEDELKAWGEEL